MTWRLLEELSNTRLSAQRDEDFFCQRGDQEAE